MIPPISIHLLSHTIQYKAVESNTRLDDREGNLSYQTVESVYVQPTTKLIATRDNQSIQANALLFWDATHSSPVQFENGGSVLFNGKEMQIISIAEFYDDTKLHHLEVGLI